MTKDEIIGLYRRAIKDWGVSAQIKMMYEEGGELITALAQFDRGRNTIEDVATEIADVMVVCEQLALIFGEELVQEKYDYKIARLKERLDKFEKEHGTEG
jgi:NTP pyrophosphatase (non-canonical NTP hydrolase)